MRDILAILTFLAAYALAGIINPRFCPALTRDDLLLCVNALDANEDGTVSAAEIDTFIGAHGGCLPGSTASNLNGTFVVTLCDTDASGNLTMLDWNSASSCIYQRQQQYVLCEWCVNCGLYPAKK